MGGLGKTVLGMAGGFIAAQASIAGVQRLMSASIGAAMAYEAQMAQIRALTGATEQDTDLLRESIREMQKTLPKSSAELGAGAYYILSSGIKDAATAAEILELSAKASTIGLGETKTIASILTSIMNAYQLSAADAAGATDTLVNIVKLGKGEPTEFAGALGRVIPIAAQMGIEFEQVGAVLATLTNTGLSAEESVTALRGIMTQILKPTDEAREKFAALGFDVVAFRKELDTDFIGAMSRLSGKVGENEEAWASLFPEVRGMIGVMAAFGNQLPQTQANLEGITTGVGALDAGFAEVSETTQFKLQKAMNDLNVQLEEVGTVGLPVVTAALQAVGDTIHDLTTPFRLAGDLSDMLSRALGETDEAADDLGVSVSETAREIAGMKGRAEDMAAALKGRFVAVLQASAESVDSLKASLDALAGGQSENIATLGKVTGQRTKEANAIDLQINALERQMVTAKMAEIGQSSLGGAVGKSTDAIDKQLGALNRLAASVVPDALNKEIVALDRELKVLALGQVQIDAQVNARKRLAQAQMALAQVLNLPEMAEQKRLELDRARILESVDGNVEDLTDSQRQEIETIDDGIAALQASINVRTLEAELTNLQAEASDANREAMQRELSKITDQIGATQDLKTQRQLYIDTLVPIELEQEIGALERQRQAIDDVGRQTEMSRMSTGSATQALQDQIDKLALNKEAIDLTTESWRLQAEAMLGLPSITAIGQNLKQAMLLMARMGLLQAMGAKDIAGQKQWAAFAQDVMTFQPMQHGGALETTRPTLFLASETGQREGHIFTPGGLPSGASGGSSQPINLNLTFTGPVLGDRFQAQQLVQWILPELRRVTA